MRRNGLVIALVLGSVIATRAEDSKSAPKLSQNREIPFRRLMVPADHPELWPRGDVKYVPMAREEFERRLKTANEQASGVSRLPARVDAARFTARLEGDALVGSAELDVQVEAPAGAFVDLEPCDVALSRPRWKGSDSALILGRSPAGVAAWVDRGGTLEFDWTLSRRRDTPSHVYALAMPRAPVRQLRLDLPADYLLAIPGAVVREAEVASAATPGRRSYHVELGARRMLELTLQPVAGSGEKEAVVLARQTQRYDISPSGTVVAVRFALGVHQHQLRQFRVRLEPGLRLMTVRMGSRNLAWSGRAQLDRSGDLITIELPEPVLGGDRELVLDAIAPTVLGKPWRLPAMRPQQVVWQDAVTDLAIANELKLVRIRPLEGQLASPLSAGQIRVEHFAPDSAIELAVDWQPTAASLAVGTAMIVEPGQLTATCRCELRGKSLPRPLLRAQIGTGWIIDDVQAEPPAALDDWTVKNEAPGQSWLAIGLKSSATAERTRLTINARRAGVGPAEKLSLHELLPLRWNTSPATVTRQVVSLRSNSPWSLDFSGEEELSGLESNIAGADRELLGGARGSFDFVVDSAAHRLRVGLRQAARRFRADLNVEAIVEKSSLTEQYTIRCTPETEALPHVLAHFSAPRVNDPAWSIAGQPVEARHVRRLSERDQRQAGLDPGGETWIVTLDPPRSAPFDLVATRTTTYAASRAGAKKQSPEDFPVSLVMLPEAIAQEGRVAVRALDGMLPRMRGTHFADRHD